MRPLIASLRDLRASLTKLVTRTRTTPLPEVEIVRGPAIPAWVIHLAAAFLPILLIMLMPVRTHLSTGLLIFLIIVSVALGALVLLLPSTFSALVAIGSAAVFSLTQPPSLPWALLVAALGYLAFRAGVAASQIPRTAKIENTVLLRFGLRDLLVIGATGFAGLVALLAQRLTGCSFSGASIAEMTDLEATVQTCNPAGSVLVVLAALAFLALFLGLAQRFLIKE